MRYMSKRPVDGSQEAIDALRDFIAAHEIDHTTMTFSNEKGVFCQSTHVRSEEDPAETRIFLGQHYYYDGGTGGIVATDHPVEYTAWRYDMPLNAEVDDWLGENGLTLVVQYGKDALEVRDDQGLRIPMGRGDLLLIGPNGVPSVVPDKGKSNIDALRLEPLPMRPPKDGMYYAKPGKGLIDVSDPSRVSDVLRHLNAYGPADVTEHEGRIRVRSNGTVISGLMMNEPYMGLESTLVSPKPTLVTIEGRMGTITTRAGATPIRADVLASYFDLSPVSHGEAKNIAVQHGDLPLLRYDFQKSRI